MNDPIPNPTPSAGIASEMSNEQLRDEIKYLREYVIPEKDKHGKYWHDLAQERLAAPPAPPDASAQRNESGATEELDDLISAGRVLIKYSKNLTDDIWSNFANALSRADAGKQSRHLASLSPAPAIPAAQRAYVKDTR